MFPTYALWRSSFAYTQLFETLHSKHAAGAMKKRWGFFWTLVRPLLLLLLHTPPQRVFVLMPNMFGFLQRLIVFVW